MQIVQAANPGSTSASATRVLSTGVNDGDVVVCAEAGPYAGLPGPVMYAMMFFGMMIAAVGLFAGEEVFFDRLIWSGICGIWILAVATWEFIAAVFRRAARVRLRELKVRTLGDVARLCQLRSKTKRQHVAGFDTMEWLRLTGEDGPRVICLDCVPYFAPEPEDIAEEVDVEESRRLNRKGRGKARFALICRACMLALFVSLYWGAMVRTSSLSEVWPMVVVIACGGVFPLYASIVRLGFRPFSTRHIKASPGKVVCTALYGSSGEFARENAVLILRPEHGGISAEFHRVDGKILKLNYGPDLEQRGLDSLVGRWCYPGHKERTRLFHSMLDRGHEAVVGV